MKRRKRKLDFKKEVNGFSSFAVMISETERIACLHSINQLIRYLKNCPVEALSHHTNNGKNDFARWIDEVFGHNQLARELHKLKTDDLEKFRKRILGVLNQHITQ